MKKSHHFCKNINKLELEKTNFTHYGTFNLKLKAVYLIKKPAKIYQTSVVANNQGIAQ